jgi:hypothetical protein
MEWTHGSMGDADKNEGHKTKRTTSFNKILTMEDITPMFPLPLNDAAIALGTCATNLKIQCRRLVRGGGGRGGSNLYFEFLLSNSRSTTFFLTPQTLPITGHQEMATPVYHKTQGKYQGPGSAPHSA